MSTLEVRAGLPHTGHTRALIEPLESRRLLSGISSPLGLMLESTPLISSEPLVHARAAKSISWTEAAPSPIPRFEAAGEVVGGKLYVFGGFVDADVHATARSDVFNPRKNTWTQIADMPEPLTHTGHVIIGHKIWFVGGFVGDEGDVISPSTTHTWIYDTKKNTWASGPDLPAARGAGALTKVGNRLDFFGGLETRAADQAEHWVLNLHKLSAGWASAAPLPTAVNHLAGVALSGKIYAIGGQHLWDEDSGNVDLVQVYNPRTGTWTQATPLPAPRGHVADSTFISNGKIVVAGGATNGIPALSDVIVYRPSTDSWTGLSFFPAGRRAPVARAIGGKIIVTTGDPGDVSATDQTWISSRAV
ncbi:MAG TPA: kelch repeat-containing protein [Humisphaera sp.]|jgi:N-acetylneuraminic acid mutarotase|nr:kelch repeat-containing protein [Humisphaera sp.]